MKLKFFVFLFVLFMPLVSSAQGCVTIFSEQGVRFFLLLNGEKQNPQPESDVRIDNLTGDSYSAKILFEDPAKAAISKTIMNTKDITGQSQEITYKIEQAKDGSYELVYIDAVPMPTHFADMPGIYHTHYVPPGSETNNQNHGGNGGGSITIIPAGVNLQINTPAPNDNGSVQISGSNSFSPPGADNPAPPPAREKCASPMDGNSFKVAKQAVAQAAFEDTKLGAAEAVLDANCVSTAQVIELCKLFGFEDSKLTFAKNAYLKTTDPGNYAKVANVFSFNASKADLKKFISNGGR